MNKISDYLFLMGIICLMLVPILIILSATFYNRWVLFIFIIAGIVSLIGVVLIIISVIINFKNSYKVKENY